MQCAHSKVCIVFTAVYLRFTCRLKIPFHYFYFTKSVFHYIWNNILMMVPKIEPYCLSDNCIECRMIFYNFLVRICRWYILLAATKRVELSPTTEIVIFVFLSAIHHRLSSYLLNDIWASPSTQIVIFSFTVFLDYVYTGMLHFRNICYLYEILATCTGQCQANSKKPISCKLHQVVLVGTDLCGILFAANTTSSQHVRLCGSCFDRSILWVSRVDNAIACDDALMSAVVPMIRGISMDMTNYVRMGFSLVGKSNNNNISHYTVSRETLHFIRDDKFVKS